MHKLCALELRHRRLQSSVFCVLGLSEPATLILHIVGHDRLLDTPGTTF